MISSDILLQVKYGMTLGALDQLRLGPVSILIALYVLGFDHSHCNALLDFGKAITFSTLLA